MLNSLACGNSWRHSARRMRVWSASVTVLSVSFLLALRSQAVFLLLLLNFFALVPVAAPEEAAKIWRELDEATQARNKAEKTVRAAENELVGLVTKKRELEASVQTKREACGILRGELQESNEQ